MSWHWLPATNHPPPLYILNKDGIEISHPQSSAPPGTGSILSRKQSTICQRRMGLLRETSEQGGRLNPLQMSIATEAGALFDNQPRCKNKALLLDITTANSCTNFHLDNAARHAGKHVVDAVERKKNNYRGSFPATYCLLLLPVSTCGKVG